MTVVLLTIAERWICYFVVTVFNSSTLSDQYYNENHDNIPLRPFFSIKVLIGFTVIILTI